MLYPPKRDWWAKLLTIVIALLAAGGGSMLVHPDAEAKIAGGALFAVHSLIFWCLVTTSYEITDQHLIWHFGPFFQRRRFATIAEASTRGTRGLLSRSDFAPGWNMALSTDMIVIRFHKPGGGLRLMVLRISPLDQEGFLDELASKVDGLRIRRS